MSSDTDRYPLSTADGKHIPLEIIKPHGFVRKSFTAAGASAQVTIPATIEIISFQATENCIILFDGNASVPADGTLLTSGLYVPNTYRVTVAPIGSYFTVIGETASGLLYCQMIEKWAGLSLSVQSARR
jgi:hypothetical protein